MIILLPILTNGAKLYSQKLTNIHFWCHLFGGIGMGAFTGMAGLHGMLSHTLYINGEFMPYNVLAAIPGTLLLIAFLAFLYNVIITVGINGLLGIFKAPKLRTTDLLPKA